jgi:thioredoxin reductase
MSKADAFDVVIVGAGPAGLSAALMLGRCRRRVALCDDGHPRNAGSNASYGFFTQDGADPRELLRVGRAQLAPYDVVVFETSVVDARRAGRSFAVLLASHRELIARRLLLATGIVDEVPRIDGIDTLYGTSVFPCPYCDAFELRDQPLAVYAHRADAVGFAVGLKSWSDDLVLCLDGARSPSPSEARRLERYGIAVRTERIVRLEGRAGVLKHLVFESGERLARRAMFFDTGTAPRSELAAKLGCDLTRRGMVKTDNLERSDVPGVYVAGDASCDLNFIAVAAAEGLKAGFAIHKALHSEDFP